MVVEVILDNTAKLLFLSTGLNSLAVRHYERVLEMTEVRLNTGGKVYIQVLVACTF